MNAPAKPAQFDRSAQPRRAMIAKIDIAKGQLGLDEDDYRQILFEETGKNSSADCTEGQLAKVIDRFKRQGFQALPKVGAKKPAAQHPMARKARAMWISLHQLGVVRNPSEEALEAFACKQLGCEKLVWARQSDANKLIEALKAMAVRAGWRQTNPKGKRLAPAELQFWLCDAILERLKAAGEVPQDWNVQTAAFRLCGIELPDQVLAPGFIAEHWQRVAAALGAKLRAAGGAEQ